MGKINWHRAEPDLAERARCLWLHRRDGCFTLLEFPRRAVALYPTLRLLHAPLWKFPRCFMLPEGDAFCLLLGQAEW